jgi:hypothetical protein
MSYNKVPDPPINKGVELMLRRMNNKPLERGLKVHKRIALLKKVFNFKIEFTWED